MRLSCFHSALPVKHSLDGSLPDLPLTKADPGNLPLELSCKEKKPVKHQVLNSTQISKSSRKLLGYPSFFSALMEKK